MDNGSRVKSPSMVHGAHDGVASCRMWLYVHVNSKLKIKVNSIPGEHDFLFFSSSSSWGKSYGGHDDVQTVFGQAILVAEFSPKKIQIISVLRRPPALTTTPFSSGSTQILKRRQHYTYLSTNKRRQSIMVQFIS